MVRPTKRRIRICNVKARVESSSPSLQPAPGTAQQGDSDIEEAMQMEENCDYDGYKKLPERSVTRYSAYLTKSARKKLFKSGPKCSKG